MSAPDGTLSRLRWPGLPPRILLGFGAAIVSVAAAAGASYAALTARTAASRLVRHTAEAQLAIEEIRSALMVSDLSLEAAAAAGGSLNRDRFLRASSQVQPPLARLERIAEQHPDQKPRIARLAADVDIVCEEQAQVLGLISSGDLPAAREIAARSLGRDAFARAMGTLDQLEADEASAHLGREAAWKRNVLLSNAVFGGALGVLLVLILVAARLVREDIRQRQADRAERERALGVQQRLMAVVSHDLRNPISGILAGGWALERLHLPPQASSITRRIIAAAGRIERLVRDLLDWSVAQRGGPIPIATREADLHDVCQRIADEFQQRDGDRIRVEREGDPRATFDPDRMEQVVGNLLSNSLRHAPSGTQVVVRAVGTPHEVRLEVHDDGTGIPPEAQAHIFEPFRRGPNENRSGVGLGLFIVRAVAEAHGGSVDVSSAPGSTTFVVRLPRDAPHRRPSQ